MLGFPYEVGGNQIHFIVGTVDFLLHFALKGYLGPSAQFLGFYDLSRFDDLLWNNRFIVELGTGY